MAGIQLHWARHSCTLLKVMHLFKITDGGINAQLILILCCYYNSINHLNNISANTVLATKHCSIFHIDTNHRENKLMVYIRSHKIVMS